MGFTLCWATEQALTEDEVRAALRLLALEHDRKVFKVASYDAGCGVVLVPVRDVAVESFVFVVHHGVVTFGFCKTNHCEPETTEMKRLLARASQVVGGKLKVSSDDTVAHQHNGTAVHE